jgi:hypothetical protein
LTADKFNTKGGQDAFGQIAYELLAQSFALYEENSGDSRLQGRCILTMVGTLLACRSLSTEDYESLIMKTAQYSAKMLKKTEQCEMVALCSYLFHVIEEDVSPHPSCCFRDLSFVTFLNTSFLSGYHRIQQTSKRARMFATSSEACGCVY